MTDKYAGRGSDSRLVKSAGDTSRESRDSSDKVRTDQDGTTLSIVERIRSLRSEMGQEILPNPPVIPGWHCCWLSTTNSTDPIHIRISRFGYEPVKAAEVQGFDQLKLTSGEFDGCIACNEMILFKVPDEIYQTLMLIAHHEKPLENEQGIRSTLEQHAARDNSGRSLSTLEGFDRLGKPVAPPIFQ